MSPYTQGANKIVVEKEGSLVPLFLLSNFPFIEKLEFKPPKGEFKQNLHIQKGYQIK